MGKEPKQEITVWINIMGQLIRHVFSVQEDDMEESRKIAINKWHARIKKKSYK